MSRTVKADSAIWPEETNGWYKRYLNNKASSFNTVGDTQRTYTALINDIRQGSQSDQRIGMIVYNNHLQLCFEIHHQRNKMARFIVYYDRVGSHDLDIYDPIVDLLNDPNEICSFTKSGAQERFFICHDETIQLNVQTPEAFFIPGIITEDNPPQLPLYFEHIVRQPLVDEDNNAQSNITDLGWTLTPVSTIVESVIGPPGLGLTGYVNPTSTGVPSTGLIDGSWTTTIGNSTISQEGGAGLITQTMEDVTVQTKGFFPPPRETLQFQYEQPVESFMTHAEIDLRPAELQSSYNIFDPLEEARRLSRGALYLYVLVRDNDDIDGVGDSFNKDVTISLHYCISFEDK